MSDFFLPKLIARLFVKKAKKVELRPAILTLKSNIKRYFWKAGYDINPTEFSKKILFLSGSISLLIALYFTFTFTNAVGLLWYVLVYTLIVYSVISFPITLFLIWIIIYVFMDLRIYNRRQEIEAVLADFLQLTSANVRAGLTIDRALWLAVKPRFGILAKEIEIAAKESMAGQALEVSLMKFADKYDSELVHRSIRLLLEGMRAGGEVGNLLNKIASNIQEIRLLRKEMASSVTTYVIFISFSSVAAAPFLFALSEQLLAVMTKMVSTIGTSHQSGMSLSIGGAVGITQHDFQIFAVFSLMMTSCFSAMIVATLKTGSVKSGLRYIPIFIAISLFLFFIESYAFSSFFKSLF